MVNLKVPRCPTIAYRPIRPSDLVVLEKIHGDLFPIRYESEFFYNVVHGRDIVSWGAVDRSLPGAQSDELIGFVTARVLPAKKSGIQDLLSFDSSITDTLVYILTLGVVESRRNLGIRKLWLAHPAGHKLYDSYLFVYFVKGGRYPCSPRELVAVFVNCVKSGSKDLAAKLWKYKGRKFSKRLKCKESGCLLPTVVHNNKRPADIRGL